MQGIQEKLGTSAPYICGGTPRDRLMKRIDNISDLDITTGDKTVQYLAQEFGGELAKKYNVTRRSHEDGHSSIYIGNFKMDFSSNFNVPNIDSLLNAKGIKTPTEMQKEMFSRDFTCNALLLSIDLKNLVDPTGNGFNDIKDKVIRTCLSPEITLTTNKNRVIRAIYLASKLDFDIDPKIIEFVQKNPQSVKISSEKTLAEKLNEAFNRDADKAAYYITKMGLWKDIPITEVARPYYMKSLQQSTKVGYFQGGGGVNEPTPKKKKYKSEPALVVQPRFKEPFYRNYDLYDVPGFDHIGPGAGYHSMQKYKSVSEFLDAKRKKMKDKYKADDSWKQDDGKITKKNPSVKARTVILERIIKMAGPNYDLGKGLYDNMDKYDSVKDFRESSPHGQAALMHKDINHIDFPLDKYTDPAITAPEPTDEDGGNPVGEANLMGGYLDEYLPKDDAEDKPPTALDFGRDYTEGETREAPKNMEHIEKLLDKYLAHGTFGLPDGVDLPDEELKDPNPNPFYGTTDVGITSYEDKWNI